MRKELSDNEKNVLHLIRQSDGVGVKAKDIYFDRADSRRVDNALRKLKAHGLITYSHLKRVWLPTVKG